MRRILPPVTVLLLAAVGALAGCGGENVVAVTARSGTEVRVGQQFTITMDSNRTTGFQWQLAKPLDETIVKLVGAEYRAPDALLPGAGGKEIWTFRAQGSGKAEIAFKYVRPWEKDAPPAREQDYAVTVKSPP